MRLIFTLFLYPALPMLAQQAAVSGRVLDVSQSSVGGVHVRLTDTLARVSQETKTNPEGFFAFSSIRPGSYELTAEFAGFATARVETLRVEVGETKSVNIELRPSELTETVNVEASATPLTVNRADRSQVVEISFVNSIPLNVRNPLQFLNYTVGVTAANRSSGLNTSSQSQTNTFRINGAKGSTTDILLDGAVNTTSYANQAAGIPQVDAVQESRVFTSAYAPEYGRTSGGMVLFGLKSGTNDVHGTFHEFLRNSRLDANGFNANKARLPRQAFQRNQFGLTFGAPVVIPKLYNGHNRTFFFLALEGLRERAAGSFTGTVPTALEGRGDFSQSRDVNGNLIVIYDPHTTRLDPARPAGTTRYIRDAYAGNTIPTASVSALGLNILKFIPSPNQPGLGLSNTNNFFSSDPTRNQQDRVDTRVDHIITDRHRVFARWNYFQNLNIYNDPYKNSVSPSPGNNRLPGMNMMAQHTWIVSPALLVEHHFSFAQHESNRTSNTVGFDAAALGIDKNTYDGAPVSTFPQVLGNRFTGVGQGSGYERNRSRVYQYEATASYIRGKHSFKAGLDFRLYGVKLFTSSVLTLRLANNFTGGPNPQAAATASGHGIADLLLNAGTASNLALLPDLSSRPYYGIFFQDEFRVTPKLTVTYGLRYNLELPDLEDNDHYTYLDLASVSPLQVAAFPNLRGGVGYVGINGLGRRTQDAQTLNFDPRIGIAYQMNNRTVVRSGFGIFHHSAPSFLANGSSIGFSQTTTSVATQPDGVTPLYNLADPFPTGMLPLTGNTLGLATNVGQSITAPFRSQNVSYQAVWSFDVQRELIRNLVVTAGYAGNAGIRLLSNVNINQLPDSALVLGTQLLATVPNPFAGVINDPTSLLSRSAVQYGQLLRPYPHFQNITASLPGVGHSSYHALQLQVERRLTNGLAILFAYTHSKNIDNIGDYLWVGDSAGFQNNNCFSCDRSLSLQDIPDVVRFSTRYELPFGPGKPRFANGVASHVIGGWAVATFLSWDNGTPVRVTSPNDSNSFGGGTNNRPTATGQPARLADGPTIADGGAYFNAAAFIRTPSFQFGNVGRTLPDVRVPGVYNWDIMIEKRTHIAERVNLDFRTEMFNAFNLVNFAGPGTNFATADFGKIFLNQVNPPRQIQFGLRLVY